MNKLELFKMCNQDEIYTQIGDGVDYAFVEDPGTATLYIFFEPSDGLDDWRNNFSYWRRPYKDMEVSYRVHGGFLKCWKTVEKIVIAKILEEDPMEVGSYRWRKVVVVGYSHGGALAALCHECVWFHRGDLRERDGLIGYGFEAPRVYAGLWIKKELKARWKNFTVVRNKNDLVTHMPPLCFFFRHVGALEKIGKRSKCGPIAAHYRTWVRVGLGEKIDDIEAELAKEKAWSKAKKKAKATEKAKQKYASKKIK